MRDIYTENSEAQQLAAALAGERRFCEPSDGKLGDRCPRSPWMRERLEVPRV